MIEKSCKHIDVARKFVDFYNHDPTGNAHKKAQLGPMAAFLSMMVGPDKLLEMGPLNSCSKQAVHAAYDSRVGETTSSAMALYTRMRKYCTFETNSLTPVNPSMQKQIANRNKTVNTIWGTCADSWATKTDWARNTTYNFKFIKREAEAQYKASRKPLKRNTEKRKPIPKPEEHAQPNSGPNDGFNTSPTTPNEQRPRNQDEVREPLVWLLTGDRYLTELALWEIPGCDYDALQSQLQKPNRVLAQGKLVTAQLMLSPTTDLTRVVESDETLSRIVANSSTRVELAPNQRLPLYEKVYSYEFQYPVQRITMLPTPFGLIAYGTVPLKDVTVVVPLRDKPSKTSNQLQSKFGGFSLDYKGNKIATPAASDESDDDDERPGFEKNLLSPNNSKRFPLQ